MNVSKLKLNKYNYALAYFTEKGDFKSSSIPLNLAFSELKKKNESDSNFQKRLITKIKKEKVDFLLVFGYKIPFTVTKDDCYLVLNVKRKISANMFCSLIEIEANKSGKNPKIGVKNIEFTKKDFQEKFAKIEQENCTQVLNNFYHNYIEYQNYPKSFYKIKS